MVGPVRRWRRYLTARLTDRFDESADSKVELEQAITEAREQHQRLKEQATNVIAGQQQAEIRLDGKLAELAKLDANARQALLMAAEAGRAGDGRRARECTTAAETIASRLVQVERDVESLEAMVIERTEATDHAKAAVQQNSRLLQEKIAEKSKLLSRLEQAKMQEETNAAMIQLNETIGDDVPTLAEVENKIRARHERATASAELSDTSVEARMLEIEEATANAETRSRLAELRAELGLVGEAPPPVEGAPDSG